MADGIKIGNLDISAFKASSGDCKVYLGDVKVYPSTTSIENAVITCDSATYNGQTQVATNIVVTLSGVTLIQGTDYIVTSNTGGTNAGNYTVTVQGINDYEHTASGTFTINKVTPTVVSPTAKVLTYNGSAQELVNAGSTNFGTLQYKVGSDSWSTSIPTRTRGGSYEVQYRVVGDSNVNDVAAQTVQCSINEKQVTATVTLSQTTYTYNGTAFEPTPTVKDGSIIIDPSEYTVTYSNNINAGTGTVTISDNVGGDYNVIGSATFTINKADTAYTAPTSKSLTYNLSAQALLNAGSVTGGTIYYSSDNRTWSTTIPSQTNAGTYTSYWKITGDVNHNDKASASISTTISPKTVSSPTITLSQTSYTYSNSACKPTPTVKDGSTTIASSEYTVSYSNNINVGTATCTITDNSGGNYTVSGSKTFTINCYSATAPTAKSLTWTGNAQNLVNAGSTSYGTMLYCTTSGGTFSTTIPTGTNAGSYEVWWKVTGNTNVCNTAATKVSCSIAKVAMSYKAPSAATRTYTGSAQQIVSGASATGGSIQYCSTSGGTYTTTVPIQTNAGTSYSTWWKAVPDGNHSGGTSAAQITGCTINKADGRVISAPIPKEKLLYNGSSQPLVNPGYGTGTMMYKVGSGSWGTSIPTATNAVDYQVYYKASASTNYNESASGSVMAYIYSVKIVNTYNVTSTSTPTKILDYTGSTNYNKMYIDNIDTTLATGYTFNSTGNKQVEFYHFNYSVSFSFTNCITLKASVFTSYYTGGIVFSRSNFFAGCSGLTGCTLPPVTKNIGYGMFSGCTSLSSFTMPNGVTSIGGSAFYACTSLTNITIPGSVSGSNIGGFAFYGCTSLTSCTINGSKIEINTGTFIGCSALTGVYGNIMDCRKIGDRAFYGCSSLKGFTGSTSSSLSGNLVIPNSATTIGELAFQGCSGLTAITSSSSSGKYLTTIGNRAFEYCRGLQVLGLTYAESLTSIGESAFNGCTSLVYIYIPSGVTSIGDYAFQACTVLFRIYCYASTAPTIQSHTFYSVKSGGTLYVKITNSGYDTWMGTGNYYLGKYNWTKSATL